MEVDDQDKAIVHTVEVVVKPEQKARWPAKAQS